MLSAIGVAGKVVEQQASLDRGFEQAAARRSKGADRGPAGKRQGARAAAHRLSRLRCGADLHVGCRSDRLAPWRPGAARPWSPNIGVGRPASTSNIHSDRGSAPSPKLDISNHWASQADTPWVACAAKFEKVVHGGVQVSPGAISITDVMEWIFGRGCTSSSNRSTDSDLKVAVPSARSRRCRHSRALAPRRGEKSREGCLHLTKNQCQLSRGKIPLLRVVKRARAL